ncbi:uncharacterized protein LOC119725755 [Patiria miniata]|uniref:Uncharacterized protein n=1 Tax=Patiria miniata TaxID=46514 RepID=A0A913ZQ35_PATMI|nr:uncharacterized protein LOC119725755 [Patiria miniata]
MTGGPGSTKRHYRRLLDKLKARSSRIFVKTQMQNRMQEQRLKKVVNVLEKDRDPCIRKSHEGIWRVSSKECPMPRLAKPEGMPSYLARPRATTLPTPAELATLLPKKRVRGQQHYASHAESVATSKPPPREYTKMSKRRLSSMRSDQVQIYHYRKVMEEFEEAVEVFPEGNGTEEHATAAGGTGEKMETPTQGDRTDGKWATPVTRTKSVISEASKALADNESTAAAEESVRIVMKKLGIRPQSSPMSYSRRPRPKKRRPQTSVGTCATIAEQQLDSNSKVLRTNYLDMYKAQLKNHVRRMTSKGEMPAPSICIDDMSPHHGHRDERPKSGLDMSVLSQASTPTKAPSLAHSKFSSPAFSPESRGISNNPGAKIERQSTLMQQTASSTSRSTPRCQMRRVSTQIMHATTFDTLQDEVQKMQSYRKFRRESLQMDDVANLQDLEDGELFEEMKHCRYIRWAKADEALIEESSENEPLQHQLALLTLKYVPQGQSKKSRNENT